MSISVKKKNTPSKSKVEIRPVEPLKPELRRYVQFGIDLYHGVEKMTALPAARLGFADKGRLNVGADADVTIFDPEALKDGATFESPMIAPTGVDYVLIGGEIAANDCAFVNPACGTAVRAH